ncbi:MAG: hypothetical protein NUW01_08165 [Gemmatimonadaceae bacterium]|nr:hypothetical protein [Gemmatimonadaceae bacterium]
MVATQLYAACAPQIPAVQSPAAEIDGIGDPPGMRRALQRTINARDRASAWPGFDLDSAVLIAVVTPTGPVYVIGDSALPSGYRWLDDTRAIAVREGPPPDSLLGLQLGLDWNGRIGTATAGPLPADQAHLFPLFLVHEAFHTYQQRLQRANPRRFSQLPNPSFPDSSSVHLALLNLESAYLGRAIAASGKSTLRSNALTALAIRMRRCALLGEEECARERAMELIEGTAAYVASALLDRAPLGGAPMNVRDSLAQALVTVPDMSHLERWHYYTSGHAWLLLLEELGPPAWKSRVELSSPDVVLTEVLGLMPGEAASLFDAAQLTDAWTVAQATARDVFVAEIARRDSIERAFWDRPGVPFRIEFGQVRSLASGQSLLADGRIEYTYNFGTNRIVIRGAARKFCCHGVLTVVPTTSRSALLDGRAVALDSVGFHDSGTLDIDLPELTLRMNQASLRVYRDSVTIVSTSQ